MKDKNAIRDQYQAKGVDNYYKAEGASYSNPHFEQVRELLLNNHSRIDYRHSLDLCCGSGEVSMVLKEMGFSQTVACDPYTAEAYASNFGKKCWNLSFEDIIRGKLEGQYSSIICSFAMHLCPEKQLFPLCWQLFQHTDQLIIITPHKRPELEKTRWNLFGF